MNNNDPRLEKMPNPKQSPEKTGDGIAMVIVVILLIAIIANSPNTNKNTTQNNNSIPDGTAYVDTVQKQEKATDTSLIEHHANPIDSLVREMFYSKNR
jgi:hypothetical protein